MQFRLELFRIISCVMVLDVVLTLAYPHDNHGEGPDVTVRHTRGLIKETAKKIMKAKTASSVRYAKNILLAGATFQKTDARYGHTMRWYTKQGGI